jgi:uncharacterized protein
MNVELNRIEARVVACLIEKEITTPEYYPLTLNSLIAACNQKSNREPAMQLGEAEVVQALDRLRTRTLAWEVTSTGTRVPKYRQGIRDALPLPAPQWAVLCELMLRGPQTVGELRVHAARLAELADTAQVTAALESLMQRAEGPLVARLPRVTGQREERFAHLFCAAETGTLTPGGPPAAEAVAPASEGDRLMKLEAEVAALRNEVASLKAQLAQVL